MKIPSIPTVPQFAELFAFIEFLKNPDAVAETAKRLEEMRLAVNERLGDVDTKEKADALLAQAHIDRQAAAREKADALEGAEKLLSDARVSITSLEEAQQAAEVQRQETLAAREAEVAGRESAAATRAEEQNAVETALARREAAAAAALAEGRALKSEYEAKLAQVRAAGLA